MHHDPGHPTTAAVRCPTARAASLRRWNIALGALHALQAVAILALATAFALPVTATLPGWPARHAGRPPTTLFDIPVAWGVALFLFLSAGLPRARRARPRVFGRYIAGLAASHNFYRWAEYSLSSSVMIVLIAMITGISDVAALIGIFAANAAMILFGAVQEHYESPGGSLWPFWLGCVVGIAPWLADRRLPVVARQRGGAAGVRLRDLRVAVRLLQCVRDQHVAPVPAGRPVALVPLRREGIHGPEPRREVAARVAGVRRYAGRLMARGPRRGTMHRIVRER